MRVGGELKDRVSPGLTGERHIFICSTAWLGPKGWTEVLQMDRWAGEMCGLKDPPSAREGTRRRTGCMRGKKCTIGAGMRGDRKWL